MQTKQRPTRHKSLTKPKRSFRAQYLSLMAKRPLLPDDIYQLEKLMLLMMHIEAKNASK